MSVFKNGNCNWLVWSLSLLTLLSVTTGLIYSVEHQVNPQVTDYFTALYLTIVTTAGFGGTKQNDMTKQLKWCAIYALRFCSSLSSSMDIYVRYSLRFCCLLFSLCVVTDFYAVTLAEKVIVCFSILAGLAILFQPKPLAWSMHS